MANLKLRALVKFPASVSGSGGLKVVKTNGDYVISPDYPSLGAITGASIADPDTRLMEIYSPTTGIYNTITPTQLGASIYSGTPLAIVNGGTGAATASAARTSLGVAIGTNVQAWDADLDAVAALATTGLAARTAANTWATRTFSSAIGDITWSNADGSAGNPTLNIGGNLSGLMGLAATGIVARTGSGTFSPRALASAITDISWSNGDGVSGNPTLNIGGNLSGLMGLAATGILSRTGSGTFSPRTLSTSISGLSWSNNDGVAGNPTLSGTVGLSAGGTGANLSATGGTSQVLQQSSVGATVTVAQVATTNLSDVSSGTWTPVLTFGTPGNLAVTYSLQTGQYIRIGGMVIAAFNIVTSAFTYTTASGNLTVTGLPITGSFASRGGALTWSGITKAGYGQVALTISGSSIIFTASGSGVVTSNVSASDTASGTNVDLRGTIIYFD